MNGHTALLTPAEHDAVAMAGELWNQLTGIVGDGPAREGDLRELIGHVHAIQQAVLKQAAARAYPDQYRLLGGHPAGTQESVAQILEATTVTCPDCSSAQPAPPSRPAPLPDPVIVDDWSYDGNLAGWVLTGVSVVLLVVAVVMAVLR